MSWSKLPEIAQQIAQQVPEPYASDIMATYIRFALVPGPMHSGNVIVLPAGQTNDAETIVHEYGHILAIRENNSLYPEGWSHRYDDVTGEPYHGLGNNALAEGYAEAVARVLLGGKLPQQIADETRGYLGLLRETLNNRADSVVSIRTGGPERQQKETWVPVGLIIILVAILAWRLL